MKKYLLTLILFVAGNMVFAAQQDPIALLQSVTNTTLQEIVAYKKSHDNEISKSAVSDIVDRVLVPYFDMDRMATMVLGRQCVNDTKAQKCIPLDIKTVTPAQSQALKTQLKILLVNLYGAALSVADQYTITFQKLRAPLANPIPEGTLLQAKSNVSQDADVQPLVIGYSLVYEKGNWYVYDITVNGAISIMSNLRSQFSPIIQQQGVAGLITTITEHNQDQADS